MNKHIPYGMAIGSLYLSTSEPGSHSPKWDIAGGLDRGENSVWALPLWIPLSILLTDQ